MHKLILKRVAPLYLQRKPHQAFTSNCSGDPSPIRYQIKGVEAAPMQRDYKTIQKNAKGEFEVQRSRFISYLARVKNEEEALSFIAAIRKKHWDARHNCAAYIIGPLGNAQKADDDGEPSGTAGKPMLEVLKKHDLKDIAAVVTRYFGGIKLGAAGLIRAYGKAVTTALAQATIVKRTRFAQRLVEFDYALLGTVENNLRQMHYLIHDKQFSDKVCLTVLTKKSSEELLDQRLNDWTSGNCTILPADDVHLELPVTQQDPIN